MIKCLDCKKYEDCSTGSGLTWPCGAYVPNKNVVKTNADHIRSMTDEELASFLCSVGPDEMEEDLWLAGDIIPNYDQHKVEDWLKQPYKEDEFG